MRFFKLFSFIYGLTELMLCEQTAINAQRKPTISKLGMLYRKFLYVLALNVARSQKLDKSSVADVHRKCGDHLSAKGD